MPLKKIENLEQAKERLIEFLKFQGVYEDTTLLDSYNRRGNENFFSFGAYLGFMTPQKTVYAVFHVFDNRVVSEVNGAFDEYYSQPSKVAA